MNPDKDFQNLIEELKKFKLPPDQFAVFGSGSAKARGLLPRGVGDLDLIVVEKLWEKLSSRYLVKQSRLKNWCSRKVDLTERIEAFEDLADYTSSDIAKLIKEADIIDGVRFVKLEECARFKKLLDRPKDRQDIKAIEDYLKKAH